ncbi:hypothetical protein OG292_22980 [Streptomyces sp. NBC_01511]|uniref:hypothetical protein n=1 Tax=Streptomyces sp. NBC_01511 TaxID=2903889 RepID=UPI00386FEB97
MTTAQASTDSKGRLPGKGGGGRPGRVRGVGVLLILLSLVPAVLCYLAFAVWLPSDGERYRDHQAAEPCPARATGAAERDCVSTWQFTVVKTVIKSGKTSTYEATLKDEDSWRGVVDFGDPGPLLEVLKPGDRVTAAVWRRDIMSLSMDGVRQNSADAPRDELQMNAALGMLAGLVAAQGFVFGAVRLVRPRGYDPFTWKPYGKRLLITTTVTCFGVGLLAVWNGIAWWTVPAVGIPVALCVAGLMYHRLRPRAAGGV